MTFLCHPFLSLRHCAVDLIDCNFKSVSAPNLSFLPPFQFNCYNSLFVVTIATINLMHTKVELHRMIDVGDIFVTLFGQL